MISCNPVKSEMHGKAIETLYRKHGWMITEKKPSFTKAIQAELKGHHNKISSTGKSKKALSQVIDDHTYRTTTITLPPNIAKEEQSTSF